MSWLSLVFAFIAERWFYRWPCSSVYLSANPPLQNICLAGSDNYIAAKFPRKMVLGALFSLLIVAEVTNGDDLGVYTSRYICSPEGTKRPNKYYIKSKKDTSTVIFVNKSCALLCWHIYLVHWLRKDSFFLFFKA